MLPLEMPSSPAPAVPERPEAAHLLAQLSRRGAGSSPSEGPRLL